MIRITVDAHGPLLDGRAEGIVEDLAADVVDTVADVAEEHAVHLMHIYFRDPTPYYWTRVTTAHPAYLTAIVHDTGIVYGPWLEGVGSRNATSRFKGYRHWRQTRQAIDGMVPTIVEPVVSHHLLRLEG
jgi:hypothetical protein